MEAAHVVGVGVATGQTQAGPGIGGDDERAGAVDAIAPHRDGQRHDEREIERAIGHRLARVDPGVAHHATETKARAELEHVPRGRLDEAREPLAAPLVLEAQAGVPHPLLLAIATRHLFPLMLLFSLFLLLRGHNAPGGGFVGGLVAAAAFGLQLLAFGGAAVRRRLRVAPHVVVGGGLLVAAVSGLPGTAAALPYLTAVWGHAPLLGAVGTPLLFDVGVYLVVLGVVLMMLLALSED